MLAAVAAIAAVAAAIAAVAAPRMIACRSLFRVNFLARTTTNTCLQTKPLLYFQKYKFVHGFSCDLSMAGRRRRVDVDQKNLKNVTQTWRPVPSQPNCYEGDSERGKLQTRLEETHHDFSSVIKLEAESSNREVSSDPGCSDARPTTEGSKDDISLVEKLVTPEKHSLSMEVGRSLMRSIKGKRGGTRKEIETEMGVKIMFPSSKTEKFITIESNSAESVNKAYEKIQIIIEKAVSSPDFGYSHFVSLPLAVHSELVDKLVNFQNTILGIEASDKDKNVDSDTEGSTSDVEERDQQSIKASKFVEMEVENDDAHIKENVTSNKHSTEVPLVAAFKAQNATNTSDKLNLTNIPLVSYRPKELKTLGSETSSSESKGIKKSVFNNPKTFHLTVLMLKLWNEDRVKAASEVLQRVSSKVVDALENKPVSVRLKGLDCLRGSLAKARVLYAPVEEIGSEGRLLRACQVITDAFVEAGLVIEKDVQQKLKLHATVMNAHHGTRRKRTKKLVSFDARGIFDLYGSEEWGEYPIREAHLSQRFAYDENGYYHCCASIPFPNEQVD